jgi:ribosomal protein S18 acetylase RimI-like enzyme
MRHTNNEIRMPRFTIRPLRADDLPAVRAVIDSNDLFPSELMDAMTAPFLDGSVDELWFVAEAAAEVCAVAYAAPERMTDGAWNLLLIAVREDRHGLGIGGALTRHTEATLTDRAARILLVETSGLSAFERTRAVYRRLGYAEEARVRSYYADGEDKVIFWKSLTN